MKQIKKFNLSESFFAYIVLRSSVEHLKRRENKQSSYHKLVKNVKKSIISLPFQFQFFETSDAYKVQY